MQTYLVINVQIFQFLFHLCISWDLTRKKKEKLVNLYGKSEHIGCFKLTFLLQLF
jgi:hypothetical protein